MKAAQKSAIVAGEFKRAKRLAVFERRLTSAHQIAFFFELGGAPFLQILLDALDPAFGDAEVREDQFVFHRLRIARGIDRA